MIIFNLEFKFVGASLISLCRLTVLLTAGENIFFPWGVKLTGVIAVRFEGWALM